MPSRREAAQRFSLNYEEMERRHDEVFESFERGEMSMREYLAHVVFYEQRSFKEDEFIHFMYSESLPYKAVLDVLKAVKQSGLYLCAAINNESREVNEFRIQKFNLRDCFSLFFSSCYVGIRKPDPRIYKMALDVTRQDPRECLFIDDRKENVAAALAQHMRAIHVHDPANLPAALKAHGIAPFE